MSVIQHGCPAIIYFCRWTQQSFWSDFKAILLYMQKSYTKRDKTTPLIPVIKSWLHIVLLAEHLRNWPPYFECKNGGQVMGRIYFSLYFCRWFHYFFQIYSHKLACLCQNTNMIQLNFMVDVLALWWSHESVLIELSMLNVISKPISNYYSGTKNEYLLPL